MCLIALARFSLALAVSVSVSATPGTPPADLLQLTRSTQYEADREDFQIGADGPRGFVVLPRQPRRDGARPWLWYAPTFVRPGGGLPDASHAWMFGQLLVEGFTVAGVDVGESYGSPAGRAAFTAFYRAVVKHYGLAPKASLLPQSRGGLMLYNWAVEHPAAVQCIGGIYTVCDQASWPGLARSSPAYGLTEAELSAQLKDHNPIDRLGPLAQASIPILHLHGDTDRVVPLERHSGELARRYRALGGQATLAVVPGKGHEVCPEFFQNPQLVQFFLEQALPRTHQSSISAPADALPALDRLASGFLSPPPEARPWVYWFVMDGNLSREGVTADFEALARVGVGGVLFMEVDVGIPKGPVRFMSPTWRELFRHANAEAARLGLVLTIPASPGWTGSGGPWVQPEQSMQKLVASEIELLGPQHYAGLLPQPSITAGFYRDVAVLAFPTPPTDYRLVDLAEKALYHRGHFSSETGVKPLLRPVVDYASLSAERFLWDLRQTVLELIAQDHAGYLAELAHQHGLGLSIEPYDGTPCDDLTYGARADVPMGEFWRDTFETWFTCTEASSIAHTYGKPIVQAEAFTSGDREPWLAHPGSLKTLGDWAFCEGINRLVFHRYAHQPWLDRWPGMTMGPYGIHYERTQTWFELSTAWIAYLTRCQFLLQQGRFVADICYLLLVLPEVQTMTPRLLRKLQELVAAGATLFGPKPRKSPSLEDYPSCDAQVQRLARSLWGSDTPTVDSNGQQAAARPPGARESSVASSPAGRLHHHDFGRGRVYWSAEPNPQALAATGPPNPLARAQWIWHRDTNPAVSTPPGQRSFQRRIMADVHRPIASARLAMTADNSFEAWINGQSALTGDNFTRVFTADVARLLRPGTNLLLVAASNGGETPNPAGLIGALTVQYQDGTSLTIPTDGTWETSGSGEASRLVVSSSPTSPNPPPPSHPTATSQNATDPAAPSTQPAAPLPSTHWTTARVLGPLGMSPWGNIREPVQFPDLFPAYEVTAALLQSVGVAPDFEADRDLRYTHRRIDDTDLYFVSNPQAEWIAVSCAFRVSGKPPELWNPQTGHRRRQAICHEAGGRTWLPLWLEPNGATFVVFRKPSLIGLTAGGTVPDPVVAVTRDGQNLLPEPGQPRAEPPSLEVLWDDAGLLDTRVLSPGQYQLQTASGKVHRVQAPELPAARTIAGYWELQFQAGRGAPDRTTLAELCDWSQHPHPGIRHFSGQATYRTTFPWAPSTATLPHTTSLVYLDLGTVHVMARVRLNQRDLGILWTRPFRVEVTEALQPGENSLEITVANLWPNRLIGDQALSPDQRVTWTTWNPFRQDTPILESGLLGPVRLLSARRVSHPHPH